MFQYITAEEVLMPAVTKMGGEKDFVPLRTLRGDKDVQVYFNSVLKRPVWSDEDFEMFFESRPGVWEIDRDEESGRCACGARRSSWPTRCEGRPTSPRWRPPSAPRATWTSAR
ncbi:unnamed protein product [Prorocentrum cordatum]|uniref:Uncharacterized protein n=1 Tax=Prorocentrum cordatum TaxID=2364126 RepID=A0ABN9TIV0_9DINO|nr:unnamed protein product [Polarella glacialis]